MTSRASLYPQSLGILDLPVVGCRSRNTARMAAPAATMAGGRGSSPARSRSPPRHWMSGDGKGRPADATPKERTSFRLSVRTLSGREVAAVVADGAWTRRELCKHIPVLHGSIARGARFFYEGVEITNEISIESLISLSDAIVSLLLDPAAGSVIFTACQSGLAKVWRASTGECLCTLPKGDGPVWSASFSPNGCTLLAGSGRWAMLWDVDTGELLRSFPHDVVVSAVAWSSDGERVVTADESGCAKLWMLADRDRLRTYSGHTDAVICVAFSVSAVWFATGSLDGSAILWDGITGERLCCVAGGSMLTSMSLSLDCAMLLVTTMATPSILFDVEKFAHHRFLEGHDHSVNGGAFSLDGTLVFTISCDRTAKAWSVETGECVRTMQGHLDDVEALSLSACGRLLITASLDGTAKAWVIESGECCRTFVGHAAGLRTVTLSPDGALLMTSSRDMTAKIWDTETGECLRTLMGHEGSVGCAIFSPAVSQLPALRG